MGRKEPERELLISRCGICCSFCPGYRAGECPGCPGHKDHCKILQCALSKEIEYCFHCDDFPCELYEKGFDWDCSPFPTLKAAGLGIVKWKPYSDIYIKTWKICNKSKK